MTVETDCEIKMVCECGKVNCVTIPERRIIIYEMKTECECGRVNNVLIPEKEIMETLLQGDVIRKKSECECGSKHDVLLELRITDIYSIPLKRRTRSIGLLDSDKVETLK